MARAKKPTTTAVADDVERGRTLLGQVLLTDDDAARMVYADWLEERGDPAAQLIRVASDPAKVAALAKQHNAAWVEPVEAWVRPLDKKDAIFERGLYARVYGTAGKYAQKATQAALLDAATRFGVRSTMLRGKAGKVPSCATLAWTRELFWWDCQLDDDGLADLAASPHLGRLRRLTLEKVRCTNVGIRALGARSLAGLSHLGLRAPVYYSEWDERALLDVIERLSIDSLDVTGLNHLDARALGEAPAVAKLAALHIHVGKLADLATVRGLVNLRELRVQSLRTEPRDVEALLDNPAFGKLERFAIDTYTTELPKALRARVEARFETRWAYR